jgi:tetratricopeptide (TPR) repeat protein
VVLGLVVLVALSEGGFALLKARLQARAAASEQAAKGRAERVKTVAPVALAPLPVRSPLVEREGRDEFGYPRSYVDLAALRSLVGRAKYAELTEYAEDLERRYEADFHAEYLPRAVAEAFDSPEGALDGRLDAWVTASPTSFAPLLARGTHHLAKGRAARGGDTALKTDATNFTAMHQEFELARTDLKRALVLSPKVVVALRQLMSIAYVGGSRAEFEAFRARAFELCPACFQPRAIEQFALEPRWGGSYRAMKSAAAAAPVADNAKLRLLPGYAEIDRAGDFVRSEQLERALEHVERACKLGDHVDFLLEKADILERQKNAEGALPILKRAFELAPSDARVLLALTRAEVVLKDYRTAFLNLSAALRITPTEGEAARLLPSVVGGLVEVGWAAHEAGRENEAIDALDEAAELRLSSDVEKRRTEVLTSGFHGTDAELAELEHTATNSPHDFGSHVRLDYALSTRHAWARILEMWNRYVGDNPDDARAYRERAGTLMQLGKRNEARADTVRACELGSSAGCSLSQRF